MANIENTGETSGLSSEKAILMPDHRTLHLHATDHDADREFQEKFSEDLFLGTQRGIRNMLKADRETRKFDKQTLAARMNPVVNHDRDAYEYDTGPE